MNDVIRQRAAERDELLASLSHLVESDPRIEASWLFGSFGRGNPDAWSDIDVVVVAADEHFGDLLRGRYEQVATLGKVVLTMESAHNGPPGGCYLMVGYDSPTGIMLVDWYWQPRRAARTANAVKFLVERRPQQSYDDADESLVTLWQGPDNEERLTLWDPTESEDRANCAALAWAMLAIQAKGIARRPSESGLAFQEFIENLLARASDRESDPIRFGDSSELTTANDRLIRLETIARELQRSAPRSDAPGTSVLQLITTVRSATS